MRPSCWSADRAAPRVLLRGLALLALAAPLLGQAPDRATLESYYRAVGGHLGVPPSEVMILSDWPLEPEEIPVALYVADRGGISPEAVVALHRSGMAWTAVSRRYGLDAGSFYVRFEGDAGSLSRIYEAYRSGPPAQWSGIDIRDDEVVALVNLRILSAVLGVAPLTVLQARDRTGSWVVAFRTLARR